MEIARIESLQRIKSYPLEPNTYLFSKEKRSGRVRPKTLDLKTKLISHPNEDNNITNI